MIRSNVVDISTEVAAALYTGEYWLEPGAMEVFASETSAWQK